MKLDKYSYWAYGLFVIISLPFILLSLVLSCVVPVNASVVGASGVVPVKASVVTASGVVYVKMAVVSGSGVVPVNASVVPGSGVVPVKLSMVSMQKCFHIIQKPGCFQIDTYDMSSYDTF